MERNGTELNDFIIFIINFLSLDYMKIIEKSNKLINSNAKNAEFKYYM